MLKSALVAVVCGCGLCAAALAQTTIEPAKGPVDAARLKELVTRLSDDDFAVREKATEDLRAIGSGAMDALRAASESADAEVKSRASKLLAEISEDASVAQAWRKAAQEGRLKVLEGEKWYDVGGNGDHWGYLHQKGTRVERKGMPAVWRFEDDFRLSFINFTPGGDASGEILIEVTDDFVLETLKCRIVNTLCTPMGDQEVTTRTFSAERKGQKLLLTTTTSEKVENAAEESKSETGEVVLPLNALLDFIPGDDRGMDGLTCLFCMLPRVLTIWDPKSAASPSVRRFFLATCVLSGNVRTFKPVEVQKVELEGKDVEASVYELECSEYPNSEEYFHLYRMKVVPGVGVVSYSGGRTPVEDAPEEDVKLSTREQATRKAEAGPDEVIEEGGDEEEDE
jgi:hypothetical protein